MPTGPEYLQSAHDLEKQAADEQLIGQAHLDIARAQLHATYALIETVADAKDDDDDDDDNDDDDGDKDADPAGAGAGGDAESTGTSA
jgi:hypothetical protein